MALITNLFTQVSHNRVPRALITFSAPALTFIQEVELIWRQRWSLMMILYLSVRYGGTIYAVISIQVGVPTISVTNTFISRLKDLGRSCVRSLSRVLNMTLKIASHIQNVWKGTRVDLLNYIYRLLDNREKSQIIWLHGTAGVGKSAVAFTVAERMRSLKVMEETNIETRLAGTFFFSCKHTQCSTTGHFFATLAYQLARNFPSVKMHDNGAIRKDPVLLDPSKCLQDQMKALFRQPLSNLQWRLRECMPPMFVIDALDECKPKTVAELISLLGQALRDPDLPVIHILLMSRLEEHIRKAIQKEDMRSLVCSIPVNISGEGVFGTISLDGTDVDNDIYIFLQHSFRDLQIVIPISRSPPRMSLHAWRAEQADARLELLLKLTSELLPGMEVYELYDRILSICADPKRAYLHLSVVAALADPLPISQISKLLGPGQGMDVEITLAQLQSIMDIPTDSSLPMNPSNCRLSEVQSQASIPAHFLLAECSFCLMVRDIPKSTALLDVLLELKEHSQTVQTHDPQSLQQSLAFIIEPPEPLHVLTGLLWLWGVRGPDLRSWLETPDGYAWLQTQGGDDWLQMEEGGNWLPTRKGGGLAEDTCREHMATDRERGRVAAEWQRVDMGSEMATCC
ncbi:uncharacterized protein EDB91DRAFT_1254448 [Suillus paluster]|uniref:uncharacterized protein n=1 Tax=Suillus paluster TaxID=48578 RepID=UPI001B880EBE|nr:uncharacterized protein EDB91DRAFT_1254448 [Suillus paluster]KAG1726189.1 hypothetical protein EDB91DRAFT_1254448 [Suillus paluster]